MKHHGFCIRAAIIACCATTLSSTWAGDGLPVVPSIAKLLPAENPVADVIDHYVDAQLKAVKLTPAAQADDANFLRRVTLDLVGRIPTPPEVHDFVDSTDSQRRERLVDRLIASPEFLDHQVNEFDWMMTQGQGSLRVYLTEAFRDGRSWDRIFRDLMLADDEARNRKGANDYLKSRLRDTDKLTNDVSSLFFGVNISCAQCHDHPLAKDWKQGHFYGFKSFFNRTFENGDFLGERDYGLVSYQTPKGEQHKAELMFLSGRKISEPEAKEPDGKAKKEEQDELKKLAEKKMPPPAPKFSRRAALVETALKPEERSFFARAIVNRIWYRLLGHGLVMPVDQMHSANPASHPELLEWLARDTANHQFQFTRLIRGIVLSRAYGRSSRWDDGERPAPETFAVAQVRPLTPQQYGAALRVAAADPESWKSAKSSEDAANRARGMAQTGRSWAPLFAPPSDDFQVSVTEALLLANDPRIENELLGTTGDKLVARMIATPDPTEAAVTAFTTILCRRPEADEQAAIVDYVNERRDRLPQAVRQVVWSLLTGSEMRFNY